MHALQLSESKMKSMESDLQEKNVELKSLRSQLQNRNVSPKKSLKKCNILDCFCTSCLKFIIEVWYKGFTNYQLIFENGNLAKKILESGNGNLGKAIFSNFRALRDLNILMPVVKRPPQPLQIHQDLVRLANQQICLNNRSDFI